MSDFAEVYVAHEIDETHDKNKLVGRKGRIITFAGLASMSLAANLAERYNLMIDWPGAAQAIGKSLQHPAVGYAGAWLAAQKSNRHPYISALAAATTADFVTEAAQAVITDPDRDPFEPLARSQWLENTKDYLFALGGMSLLLLQNRISKK